MNAFPFSDLALSRRLERAEAQGNVSFVETRARVAPESGAMWIEVAGAYAMYDGPTSPCTQTFGLGLFEPVTIDVMQRIEAFFCDRKAPVFHEVSPLADPALVAVLNGRGYEPVELTSILFRPIGKGQTFAPSTSQRLRVRVIEEGEQALWAHTSARGWSEFAEYADLMLGLAMVTTHRTDAASFLAELDGEPMATGAVSICDGVALLAGASTVPERRKQGAQLALLDGRLHHAADAGCDLAMMCARPGSASQRNAERHGFRIAYTRIKWGLRS